MFISVLMIIVAALLALVVLAQNPKGGGLAAGFTGAQQIGGVQRTADFLEKSTWTLATALMVLCLISGVARSGPGSGDPLDEKIEVEQPKGSAAPAGATAPDSSATVPASDDGTN